MGKLIFSTLSIGHLASGWIQVFENSNIFTPEWKQSQGGKGKIFFSRERFVFQKKISGELISSLHQYCCTPTVAEMEAR